MSTQYNIGCKFTSQRREHFNNNRKPFTACSIRKSFSSLFAVCGEGVFNWSRGESEFFFFLFVVKCLVQFLIVLPTCRLTSIIRLSNSSNNLSHVGKLFGVFDRGFRVSAFNFVLCFNWTWFSDVDQVCGSKNSKFPLLICQWWL